MNRYLLSFIITFILYISLFASYILYFNNEPTNKTQKVENKRVSFNIIQNTPKKKEPIEKQSIKKQIVQEKIKPAKAKKIIKEKKVKPKKKIVKKIKKKVIKKKKIKKTNKKVQKHIQKKIAKKVVKKELVKPVKNNKKQCETKNITTKTAQKKPTLVSNKLAKQKYFSQIKSLINKNKIYPKRAIKRGIQGVVNVEFTINKNGQLVSINNLDGKSIFFKSIKKAISKTFPFAPPKGLFKKDMVLNLKLVYKLN